MPTGGILKPGDIALVRSSGFVGWAIRVVTRSKFNHVRLIVSEDGRVIEANPDGADWGQVQHGDVIVSVPLTDAQRAKIPAISELIRGIPYGFLDVAALGLARLGITLPSVKRRIKDPHTLFCSQLVDYEWELAGFHAFDDGRVPQDVTPGDLDSLAEREGWSRYTI